MPTVHPIATSEPRDSSKRARSVPPHVRAAIVALVYGVEEGDDCRSIGLVEAAKVAGIVTAQMRRWLARPEVRAMIRAERKIAVEAAVAGNPAALVKVRSGGNAMASVAASRAIEEMHAAANGGARGGGEPTPGVVIRIQTVVQGAPPALTVEGHAERALGVPYAQQPPIERPEPAELNPVFRPPR